MNKALFILNDNSSIPSLKALIENYATKVLVLSNEGNYRPTKLNIEKALLWLRCSKCDPAGLLRCGHGYNHPPGTTLYLFIDMPNNEDKLVSLDNKTITQDYIFRNLFYALPKSVKLWSVMNLTISCLEYKLVETSQETYKISKQDSISIRGDVVVLVAPSVNNIIGLDMGILNIIDGGSYILFGGSFSINNSFFTPLK